MKTIFLFATVLSAIVLTSCNKDGADQNGSAQTGEDTYIGMTIQLPKQTKALGDDNATEAESKLSSVTVGVWSDGDGAVTYTDLLITDLTNVGDGTYTATKAVKAKTGKNNVIVLANTTAKLTPVQINGDAFDATVADIATDDYFVMYSDEVTIMNDVKFISKEEAEKRLTTENNATVTLRRATAKITVTSSLTETVTGVADDLGSGLLTNIVWNVANQNTQMTVFPKFVTGTDFIVSNVNSPFVRLTTTVPTKVLPIKDAAASVAYCLENAHGTDVYKENNTTAVQVSATFAPYAQKYVSEITGTVAAGDVTTVLGATPMAEGTSFFVSTKDIATQVAGTFFAEAAVDNAVTILGLSKNTDFVKYDGGKCYWAIWINDGNQSKPSYGVLRNHMYTMNIKSIKAPGLPAFPDTDNSIAADTWIMVDLDVEKWDVKNIGDIEL